MRKLKVYLAKIERTNVTERPKKNNLTSEG